MERQPKRDFLFIDETGDPGRDLDGGSSAYFGVGAVHVTDLSLESLHRHVYAMGYFTNRFRELKSSRLSRPQKDQIEDMVKWLCESREVRITVVLVNKRLYNGPYFDPFGDRPFDPVRFRNFFTKLLLEQHFATEGLMTQECDLIFDRAIGESKEVNLRQYLRGNFSLPPFSSILQCDSRYIPALQFADVVVHIVKEYVFGQRESVDGRMLRCVSVFDVTDPRKIAGLTI